MIDLLLDSRILGPAVGLVWIVTATVLRWRDRRREEKS